jgi:Cu-Zn family superoxide dismutase
MRFSRPLFFTALPLALLLGCGREEPKSANAAQTTNTASTATNTGAAPKEAKAVLNGADGRPIGEATFEQTKDGVKVTLHIDDAPRGNKGVSVNALGDCSDPAAQSMGGHLAPDAKLHALPTEAREDQHHLGDLGNVDVGDDRRGKLEITIKRANIKLNDAMSFLGRAIVIHQQNDAGAIEQPAGDSGGALACGVIEAG